MLRRRVPGHDHAHHDRPRGLGHVHHLVRRGGSVVGSAAAP